MSSKNNANRKNDPPEEDEEERKGGTSLIRPAATTTTKKGLPSMKRDAKPDPSLIIAGEHVERNKDESDHADSSFVSLGEAEAKKPESEDDEPKKPAVTKKPGAIAVAPTTAASTTRSTTGMSLRERKEQQKMEETNSAGASASSAIASSVAARSGARGAGPDYKDQVRDGAASVPGAVASSSGSSSRAGQDPSESASRPGARASNVPASKGARQKYEMMHASDLAAEAKEMERDDHDDSNSGGGVGAAVATFAAVGAVAGSAEQQNNGPHFKDQVREAQNRAGPEDMDSMEGDSERSHPGSHLVKGPDNAENNANSEEYSAEYVAPSGANRLIEAELVEENPVADGAIHVAVELHEEEPPQKPWKTIAIVVVVMLLVLGGVVGAIVGTQSNSSSNERSPELATRAPTESPPTACDNATLLELEDIVSASIGVNATILTESFSACGTADPVPEAAGVWFNFQLGENDTPTGVSISTCTDDPELNGSFDSQMLVFTGTCDQLSCMDGNDNLQQQGCASEAGVSFIAEPSVVYHVLVYGRQQGDTGDFAVQASTARVPPPNNDCNRAILLNNRLPVNTTLLNADPPSADLSGCADTLENEAPGVWFLYEIVQRLEDEEELIIQTCSPASSLGLLINVFSGSCDNLDCYIVSREADVGEGALDCDGTVDSIRFSPRPQDTTYLILVQSSVGEDIGEFSIQARSSVFELAENDECEGATLLTTGFVEEGSTAFATVGDNMLEVCGTALQSNSPDLWYSVLSSSSEDTVLRATSCTGDDLATNDFENQVVVYSGDCNNLVCIEGNGGIFEDGVCNFKGEVTWLVVPGVTYYIRVLGYTDTMIGTFGIKVETLGPPPNDICEDAIPLQPGTVTPSSTVGASADPGSSCSFFDPVESIGVWFQVVGNDEQYTVSTCSGNSSLDSSIGLASQISVYSGSSCSDLTCLDSNEGTTFNSFGGLSCNTGVSWFATNGESYWVRVFGNSTGAFPIAVNPTPENDMCEAAIMLNLNETVVGTTLGARLGPEQTVCAADVSPVSPAIPRDDLPGAWYSVVGTGDTLTLSTCTGNSTLDENGYDSQIVVFSGDCSSLTCIAGNDDDVRDECFGLNAGVSWASNAGEVYYARVYGYSTVGSFGLTLLEGEPDGGFSSQFPTSPPAPPPANDFCENAIEIISGLLAPGTTEGATAESDVGVCGDVIVDTLSPDVWYQFTGTGGVHTATTCTGILDFDSTGFDSQLVIYSGGCGNLTCITGNDDNYASPTCSVMNAVVSWLAEVGVTYFIRVMDFNGLTGNFGLRIDDGDTVGSAPVPVNNQCQDATMLVLDQVVEGTTLGATVTPVVSTVSCEGANVPSKPNPDVWYSFVGTGAFVTASTCTGTDLDSVLTFDTQLAVYTGDCEIGLMCLDGNDDDSRNPAVCALKSGVSWQADLGVTYWIQVYGFSAAGEFAITVYAGEPAGTIAPTFLP